MLPSASVKRRRRNSPAAGRRRPDSSRIDSRTHGTFSEERQPLALASKVSMPMLAGAATPQGGEEGRRTVSSSCMSNHESLLTWPCSDELKLPVWNCPAPKFQGGPRARTLRRQPSSQSTATRAGYCLTALSQPVIPRRGSLPRPPDPCNLRLSRARLPALYLLAVHWPCLLSPERLRALDASS